MIGSFRFHDGRTSACKLGHLIDFFWLHMKSDFKKPVKCLREIHSSFWLEIASPQSELFITWLLWKVFILNMIPNLRRSRVRPRKLVANVVWSMFAFAPVHDNRDFEGILLNNFCLDAVDCGSTEHSSDIFPRSQRRLRDEQVRCPRNYQDTPVEQLYFHRWMDCNI